MKLNTFNRLSLKVNKFVFFRNIVIEGSESRTCFVINKPSLLIVVIIHTRITILVQVLLWHYSRQHGRVGHILVHDRVVRIRSVNSGRVGWDWDMLATWDIGFIVIIGVIMAEVAGGCITV